MSSQYDDVRCVCAFKFIVRHTRNWWNVKALNILLSISHLFSLPETDTTNAYLLLKKKYYTPIGFSLSGNP